MNKGGVSVRPSPVPFPGLLLAFSLFFFTAPIAVSIASSITGLGTNNPKASPSRTAANVKIPSETRTVAARADRRTEELVCTLSAFFSIGPENQFQRRATLDGRGLVSCQSSQGFTTELPILADLDVELPRGIPAGSGEITVSANSSAFVVPRETVQLQDRYRVQENPRARQGGHARAPSSHVGRDETSRPTLLLRGKTHDLMIELELNSPNPFVAEMRIREMRLRSDDAAPDLQ